MQFTPKDIFKGKCISLIEKIPRHEIFIKLTGWEDINLTPHSHDRHHIIFVLSGTLHVEIGGKSYFVSDRQLVWIPERKEHRISSNNHQISLFICYFSLNQCNDNVFSIFRTDEMIVRNLNFISKFRLIDMYNESEIYSFVSGFLRAIPHICKKSVFLEQSFIVTEDKRLKSILEYIEINLKKELTVESVAANFGLSSRSLTRMFTNSGIRFMNYLNYHRIVKAIEILSDNVLNIEQTAYEVGFNSPNSFSRVFKQITGESPSSYVKNTNHNTFIKLME